MSRQSSIMKTSLFFSIALILGSGSLQAATIPQLKEELSSNNWEQLRQLMSQNPPEVIIDTNPGSNSSTNPTRNTTTNADTRFTCEYINGEYTVMYRPETRNSSFPWAVPSQLGGGWTPQRRCDEISSRLELYREDGLLEMSTGIENGYDTICVTTQINPTDCRIVLTVPPGQDPQLTRDLVFENLLIADDGSQTQGVYTFSGNGNGTDILNDIGNIINGRGNNSRSPDKIDLRPFLAPSDGGTGSQLNNDSNNSPTNPTNSERKPSIFQ
ncbi:MAG: COP23 domain-containing protein [Xenococcus sp. (in: cyanobacteria)]